MPFPRRRSSQSFLCIAATVTTAVAGLSCSFPTDDSRGYFVTIVAPSPVLVRGAKTAVVGRLWHRSAGDSTLVTNVSLLWSSDDPTVASVAAGEGGSAEITGIRSGSVDIRATAPGFAESVPGVVTVRVSEALEIDSVVPDSARYGGQVRVYGVGVNDPQLLLLLLAGSTLLPDSLTAAGPRGGLGAMSFWVPPPARSDRLFVVGPGVFFASESVAVTPRDIFEPNETVPAAVDLDAPPPYPSLPAVRLFNPALAFEGIARADSIDVDWYRFGTAQPDQPWTFFLSVPFGSGFPPTFLSGPAVLVGAVPLPPTWTIGLGFSANTGLYDCRGSFIQIPRAPSETLIVALRRLPPGGVDLVSYFRQPGRYSLAVVQGYVTLDPAIGPDRFEENDLCDFADSNAAAPGTAINLTVPLFEDTLTIDNPHDVDWYRFHLPGPATVFIATAARTGSREGDIDLRLMTLALAPIDSSQNVGSTESIVHGLAGPADYYLLVHDYQGTPMRYGLCLQVGFSCTAPATAPRPAATIRRRPARDGGAVPFLRPWKP